MCMRSYLHYSCRSLLCHVVNSILVSQPIRSLHGVIKMPPPVILLHVPQCCIDPTLWATFIFNNSVKRTTLQIILFVKKVLLYLCSNSVRPGGEELCDTGSVEASLWQAKSCPESCSSSSYHYSVKLMIYNWVLRRDLKKNWRSVVSVNLPIQSSLHIVEK